MGDQWPENERREYVERHLLPGCILRLFCHFTEPPKEKYLVLVCTTRSWLALTINTRVPSLAQRDVRRSHLPLHASEYDFLRYDSFLDCSKVHPIEKDAIMCQVLGDTGRIVGTISATTRAQVVTAVRQARTIVRRDKQAILRSLAGDDHAERG